MGSKFVSERNLKFLLYEVFDAQALADHDVFSDHDRKLVDMVLKAAVNMAKDLLFPVFEEMDRLPPQLESGEVKVHPAMRDIIDQFAQGGWLSSRIPVEQGGEGLPHMVASVCDFIFQAANMSASAYPMLTTGAAHLINSFGGKNLQKIYASKMLAGHWQGTMALTEPEAGSSLGDITTSAVPASEGHYLICGQKIFISAGDHNATENVVHLMLARIKGAPAGAKGISLFVVPKKRAGIDGSLISNDVNCSGIYHKLGYRGCPIVQLSLGDHNDCHGWLVGEANKGLLYMFQMMNEARIGVGLGATALATAAYYASLDYCRKRRQGRPLTEKNPEKPMIPIIEHADVKRMLLFQRAVCEGALSLLVQCSYYSDMQRLYPDTKKYHLLLEILTPVMKSYPAEMGILSISQGIQCLGGSGYCQDYPLEQYFRDCRIHPIHEGTTTIQGQDLLGRKVPMNNGQAFTLLFMEIQKTAQTADNYKDLSDFSDKLMERLNQLKQTTESLVIMAQDEGPEVYLADATLYLECLGIIVMAWQWLLQGISAQKALAAAPKKREMEFYQGKLFTLRYFYAYELPKASGLFERLTDSDHLTTDMPTAYFND